jgi:hypothetical protein
MPGELEKILAFQVWAASPASGSGPLLIPAEAFPKNKRNQFHKKIEKKIQHFLLPPGILICKVGKTKTADIIKAAKRRIQ